VRWKILECDTKERFERDCWRARETKRTIWRIIHISLAHLKKASKKGLERYDFPVACGFEANGRRFGD
jgi:hypothetical protein